MKKILITSISLISLVMICGSLFFMFMYDKNEPTKKVAKNKVKASVAYVIIDINPSIELGVDEDNTVTEVVTLNEDADIAYTDLDLVGKSLEDATEDIAEAAAEMGYIDDVSDDNAVSVTTSTEDEALQASLNAELTTILNNYFNTKGLGVLVLENGLDEALKAKADTYGIPYGKMLLVARAMKLDPTLVEADLVQMDIEDIQEKIKDQVELRIEAKKQAMEALKTSFEELKEERKALALSRIKAERDAILKAAEAEKGAPLTEEEKKTILEQHRESMKKEVEAARERLKTAREDRKQAIKDIRQQYLEKEDEAEDTEATQTSVM